MSMENEKNAAPQLWPQRPVAGTRDLRYAAGYFLASLLAADGLIWYGPNLALSAAMLALVALTACYLRPRRRSVSAFGVLCAIGAVAAAVSLIWTADGGVKCLALLLGLLLATLAGRVGGKAAGRQHSAWPAVRRAGAGGPGRAPGFVRRRL